MPAAEDAGADAPKARRTNASLATHGERTPAAAAAPFIVAADVNQRAAGERRPAPPWVPEPMDLAPSPSRVSRAVAASVAPAVATPPASAQAALAASGEPVATAAPPEQDPVASPAVRSQIVRAAVLSWRNGVGEAHVRLEPGSLGTVTVALRIEQGVVTARLSSDVAAVRDSINAHEQELRLGLASHGLDLDRLVVTDDAGRGRGGREAPDGFVPRRSRRADTGRRFEIDA